MNLNPTNNKSFLAQRRKFLQQLAAVSGSAMMLSHAPWAHAAATENYSELAKNGKARIAMIGIGSRGRGLMLNLQAVKHCEIVAVCDNYQPHLDRAKSMALNKNIVAVDDYQKLLDMPHIDAVVIATPLHQHANITIDALKAGKHVFCEKAMARTLDNCREMVLAEQKYQKILQIGHQRLFNPIYLKALQKVKQGEIGEVNQIRAFWHRNNNWRRELPNNDKSLERQINWRLYKEYSAGLMTELASHQIQVANWFFDDLPTKVMGSGSISFWKDGREVYDHVALIYDYPKGKKLIYDSFISNKKYGLEEQILGHLGTMELEVNRQYSENPPPTKEIKQVAADIDAGACNPIPIGGATWQPETGNWEAGEAILSGQYEDTLLQMEAFAAAVLKGKAYPGVLREGYHASIASLLGEQAMDSGQAVTWADKYKLPKESEVITLRV